MLGLMCLYSRILAAEHPKGDQTKCHLKYAKSANHI